MAVSEELETMKKLFQTWARNGIPENVTPPKRFSDAPGWSCPEYGIKGVGSKRDLNTKHEVHAAVCCEIQRLIKTLNSARRSPKPNVMAPAAPDEPTSKYLSQNTRRLKAVLREQELGTQLDLALAKIHQMRKLLDLENAALQEQKLITSELENRIGQFDAEVARLKRIIATQNGGPTLVR